MSQVLKRENKGRRGGTTFATVGDMLDMYILYLQSRRLPTDRPVSNQALTGSAAAMAKESRNNLKKG